MGKYSAITVAEKYAGLDLKDPEFRNLKFKSSTVRVEGGVYYSYATKVAERVLDEKGNPVCFIEENPPSNTTASCIGKLRWALKKGEPIIYVRFDDHGWSQSPEEYYQLLAKEVRAAEDYVQRCLEREVVPEDPMNWRLSIARRIMRMKEHFPRAFKSLDAEWRKAINQEIRTYRKIEKFLGNRLAYAMQYDYLGDAVRVIHTDLNV